METERMKTTAAKKQAAPIKRDALSIDEFCAANGISRGLYYALMARGLGPGIIKIGRRTLISVDAASAWRDRHAEGGHTVGGAT
jgi:hypothetical protein